MREHWPRDQDPGCRLEGEDRWSNELEELQAELEAIHAGQPAWHEIVRGSTPRKAPLWPEAAAQRPSGPKIATARVVTGEALFEAVDAGHEKLVQALSQKLRVAQALRAAWNSGNARALAELCRDEAVASLLLRQLQLRKQPLRAECLAHLVPLAHHVAQSSCEDHAVVAMRFVLHALDISWPSIARSLRQVGTPKRTHDACEEVVARLHSLQVTVRSMASSVRISRTNGPLSPVCRKLKVSLQEALSAVGRGRTG